MKKKSAINFSILFSSVNWLGYFPKGGFFQRVRFVFQISQSPKRNIPKNYPELEIQNSHP